MLPGAVVDVRVPVIASDIEPKRVVAPRRTVAEQYRLAAGSADGHADHQVDGVCQLALESLCGADPFASNGPHQRRQQLELRLSVPD